jgi:hypothetical protein
MFRSLVFLTLAGGVGLGAWSSIPEAQSNPWRNEAADMGFVEPGAPDLIHRATLTSSVASEPTFSVSRETIEAIRCGPWDVSEAGMEAILDEMIRRGWTPPTRATARARTQPQFGLQVTALDPDAFATAVSAPKEETASQLSVEAVEPDEPALPTGPSRARGSEQRPQFTN